MRNKLTMFIFISSVLLFSKGVSLAQNLEEFKRGKNDFVEQSTRELDKAKASKIKTRLRYAGFFDADGKVPQEKTLVEKLTFDKNGKRKELTRYIRSEMIDLRYIFKYDAKGRILKMETRNAENIVVGRRESKYDRAGNEIERKLFDKKRGDMRVVFTYDKENNLIESKSYDKNKKMFGRYVNVFENGSAKTTTVYGKDGSVQREITFVYDEAGKLTREDFKELSGSYSVDYSYDKNGNIAEIKTPQTKRVVNYNDAHDILEDKMFTADGARQYRVAFTYLENGLQNDEIRYDNSEKAAFHAQYKYEFYK